MVESILLSLAVKQKLKIFEIQPRFASVQDKLPPSATIEINQI